MSPLAAFAAPPGYLEVNLTKKNFKNYFEVVKVKRYDDFGDYNGYEFVLKSKLLKKGYYLYSADDFALKYSAKERYKYKYKKKTYKGSVKTKRTNSSIYWDLAGRYNDTYNIKYGKFSNFKILKIKGKLIFIEPSNIISIEHKYDSDGYDYGLIFKLRYPYDKETRSIKHWDEATHANVVDYYYQYVGDANMYYNGTKDGVIVR